jgi:hypothetical protein
MNDKINNWYEKFGSKNNNNNLPKGYNKHHILNKKMICCIGGTGAGKTNSLCEYLDRANSNFYQIIIFTGSTDDEFLYNELCERIPGIEFYTDIDMVPSLKSNNKKNIDDNEENENEFDKELPKLIVFDDFINLPKRKMVKINEYLTSGRKFGYTVWLMAQNYVEIPKTIIRNINYFIVYFLNDNITINNIIRNHNVDNIDKDLFRKMYEKATDEKFTFFMVDLCNPDRKYRYRKNFLNLFNPTTAQIEK